MNSCRLLATVTSAPYTHTLNNVVSGSYTFTAKATDNQGIATTSTAVTVTVNNAPTVTITSPTNNATFTAPADITITAEAQDSDGTISQVEFFNGVTLIATDTTAPYSILWTGVPAGSYSLTARVTDNLGASTTSVAVNVTVSAAVGQIFYIHADHLNTPRRIYNQTQQLVWSWDQTDPFGGNPPNENPSGLGSFTCNLRLPGQYFDQETNTHYNMMRDYDPAIGRYVQSDPAGLYAGLNTYLYAAGSPILIVDPTGLLSCWYSISEHTLMCRNNAGEVFATAMSGSGSGPCRDNPACTGARNQGPIPVGGYTIRPPGWAGNRPDWLYLDPDPTNSLSGRGGFFIHPWGRTIGCIVLERKDYNTIKGWARQDGGGSLNVDY